MASISCSSLHFSWPDGSRVLSGLDLALGPGRAGLVGPNGCGKSTLLGLLAGTLDPTGGSVRVDGRRAHLPQDFVLAADRRVEEVLGIGRVRAALRDLERGIVDQTRLQTVGDDWDVDARARAILDGLGLAEVGLDRTVGTLSGGEAVLLGLASRLLGGPDVLLLDEPTNNLDRHHRQRLYDAVDAFRGVLVAVSHDRELLERMDRIVDVRDGAARLYGGGWTAYRAAVAQEQEAAEQAVRAAEGHVRRERRERAAAQVVRARRQRKGRKQEAEARFPKAVAQERKRQAQVSAGKLGAVHDERLAAAEADLVAARQTLRRVDPVRIDLPETSVPSRRTVVDADGLNVMLPPAGGSATSGDGAPLWQRDVAVSIRGPERLALVGPNGSGKTTLLRCLAGERRPSRGTVRLRVDGVGYLPQRLDLLDPARSLLDNLRRAAPSADDNTLRARLARFTFRTSDVDQPAGTLSGGELFRATLAMLLCADPPPQLLLLDEPTNNLDLDSVAQLRAALLAFRGAIVVASHDVTFLREIDVSRCVRLDRTTGFQDADCSSL